MHCSRAIDCLCQLCFIGCGMTLAQVALPFMYCLVLAPQHCSRLPILLCAPLLYSLPSYGLPSYRCPASHSFDSCVQVK